jgi:cytochrome c oxidase subunit 2
MPREAAPSWLRTAARAGAPLLLLGLLAGCALLPPEPKTTAARDVWNLYTIVFFMGAAVFLGVEGFIVYAIFRYRRRDDRLPDQLHGNTMVEVVWTAIPTVIVLVLFVLSIFTLNTVNAETDDPGVTIEVDGFQWQWTFNYLGDAGEVAYAVTGTPANPPTMAVPINEPVRLLLRSDDVIHSFYVPQFLIKRDLIPAQDGEELNTLEFTVTEEGTYAGQCAEFCGDLHAQMTFSVQGMSRSAYDAWLEAGIAGETPRPSVEPGGTVVELIADQIEFDTHELRVPAGEPFTLRFTNAESVVHNVSIYDGDNEEVFIGDPVTGPDEVIEYAVDALEPGEYTFICDYHPVSDMTGTLIVE